MSRYYDPAICRFINADEYASTGQGLLGFNMFAYCRNNPISRKDALGTDDLTVTDVNDNDNPLDDIGSYYRPGGATASGTKGGNESYSNSGSSNGGNSYMSRGNPPRSTPSNSSNRISKNSVAMDTGHAIDTAIDFLGEGYYEAGMSGSGRFVSADGLRQVRIGYGDITGAHGGAPHINFDFIGDRYISFHVFLM